MKKNWIGLCLLLGMLSLGFGKSGCLFFWGHDHCQSVFWQLRVPRTLGALWSGSVFAAAGVLSQGMFRNPLASPGILGMSSGAAVGVSLAFLSGWVFYLPFAGLLGAVSVGAFMLFISKKTASSDRLLLAGVAISGLLGAVQSFILSRLLSDPHEVATLMQWMLGGLAVVGYDRLLVGCPLGLLVLPWIPKLCQKLNLSLLGEERALFLGVEMQRMRMECIGVVALLVSSGVYVCGILPFVGLVVPYIVRLWVGVRHQTLLVYAVVTGAAVVLMADNLGRWLGGAQEIEAGIVMGLVGSPCFFWMLKKTSSRGGGWS
ncbi:MAG: FecCD family ABC transporter permease [Oligoflexales bacterium]